LKSIELTNEQIITQRGEKIKSDRLIKGL